MNKNILIRSTSVIAIFVFLFSFNVVPVSAAPAAPLPVSPAEGATIVVPTFTWLAAVGAVKYEIEVGPQSDPNTVYWTAQTVHLTITPNNAGVFTNIPLYWRVRGIDAGAVAGAWSSKINFTKQIAAPTLVSPADGSSSVVTPEFAWQSVPGAVTNLVEFSAVSTFTPVEVSFTTYNTSITPANTLAHGLHYWRVTGVDSDGHAGTPSVSRTFTKGIPAPTLVSPANDHPDIHVPTLEWQAVQGAVYYTIELSTVSNFTPVEVSYDTYNTRITPVSTLALGKHYWRVSGVDADGHAGIPSAAWSFTKFLDAPVLVSPASDASVDIPTLAWQAVDGAASYKVEISTSADFLTSPVTYTTYNLQLTPVDALELNTYYWRVSGVDPDGHVGASDWRRFTLVAPPSATDTIPQLQAPGSGETITRDPDFTWTRSNAVNFDHFRLVVSTNPAFSGSAYDIVNTDYNAYTPFTPGSRDVYVNGTYYWKVETRTSGGTVINTSSVRSFTKTAVLTLSAPADAATLTSDPTFQWEQLVGAHHYRLITSIESDFSTTYNAFSTDYNSYTAYPDVTSSTFPNGTYYWKVEARTSGGSVIATSASRSFTKQQVLTLTSPADAFNAVVEPTFQWSQFPGTHHYRLVISTESNFSSTFNGLSTDYTSYTPYPALSPTTMPNGTYYWKVEARMSGGTVIATSNSRSFTKAEPLPLNLPVDGKKLQTTPTFSWDQIIGADHYRLTVSTSASFSSNYDIVFTDYNAYTPFSPAGLASYAHGTYYWKVDALSLTGQTISASNTRAFTILYWLFSPIIQR
jgi:large repetitive protein